MVDRSVVVRLRADVSDLKSKLASVEAQTAKIGDTAGKTAGRSKVAFADMAKYVSANEASISRLSTGALAVGAGLAVGVGVVVKTFANFDKQMSSVAATGQDARVNLDALRKASIELGASTAFSATQAAEGVENLLKAGVSAKEVIGGGLKGALDLAAAGSIGVGEAAEIAATAMTQFKLSGQDVPHLADLLAAGAGKAQGEVGDLAAALKQSGLVAAQFGLSVEDTTGTLSAFASAGLLGSDAGTSFKTMLLSLANPAAKTAELMKDLGISAYDTQGNFVGIADLADQLKTKLGGLTQAQRDQALSQIFGNDAIRAANVLYEQGGDGIREWTSKVNDAGYASETARTKLDNLSGDVEAFKGAIESAFIKSGGGANDAIRGIVQGLTNFTQLIGQIPGPVLQAGLAIAGVSAAVLLAGGGIAKLAILATQASAAFRTLGITSKAAITGIPLIGIALAAVGAGFGIFASNQAKVAAATADFESVISGMTGEITKQTVALNENVRASAAKALQDRGALDQARLLGISLDTLTDAALGNAAANATVHEAILKALRSGTAEQIQAAQGLGRSVVVVGESAAAATKNVNDLKEATAGQGDAAKVTSAKSAALAAANKDLTTQTDLLNAETKRAITQFTLLRDGVLDTETATVNWEAALDNLGKAVKGHTRSLDVATTAGRTNRRAVVDAITAMNDKATADFKATEKSKGLKAATDEATERLKAHKTQLIEAAVKAGYNRREVSKMIDQMLLTPDELRTQINTPGMKAAQTAIDVLKDKIHFLKSKKVDIDVAFKANPTAFIKRLYKMFDLEDTSRAPQQAPGRAFGGPIPGARLGDHADNVLIRATPGEFMHQKPTVDYYGEGAMRAINDRKVPRELFQGLAYGGPVRREIDVDVHKPVIPATMGAVGPLVNNAARLFGEDLARSFATGVAKKAKDQLADGGFGRIDVSRPHAWTTFRGHTFTNLAAATLRATEKDAGHTFVIFQGGNRPTTSYSGSTHNKDAIDARVDGALIRAGIHHGLKLWDRTGKGNWVSHMHGVFAPGAGFGSPSALAQWRDYLRGGDGLGGYANGTNSAAPGPAWVGERGRELINFRGGEQVLSNAQSRMLLQPAQRVVKEVRAGDVILNNPQMGADADTVVRKLHTSQRDALVMASLVPV